MTVTATTAFSGPFTPNGSTTAFPFTFIASSASEVEVFRLSAAGVSTVIGSGYTVALNGDGTGTVNFSSAPAAGDPLYIRSKPSFQQQTAFANQGNWSPTAIDGALDDAAIRDIYLSKLVDAAVKAPFNESGPLYPAAAARAGYYLTHDSNGALVLGISTDGLNQALADISANAAAIEAEAALRIADLGAILDALGTLPAPGKIALPSAFNNQLGLTPYWDGSRVRWIVNPYDAIDVTTSGTVTHYYVTYATGLDTNAGTLAAPFKTIKKAVDAVTALAAGSKVVIHLLDDYVGQLSTTLMAAAGLDGRNVKIKGEGSKGYTKFVNIREDRTLASFSWVAHGTHGAWKSNAAGIVGNWPLQVFLDGNKIPTPIVSAGQDATSVDNNELTSYWDGTYLYVHLPNGVQPNPFVNWEYSNNATGGLSLTQDTGSLLFENCGFFKSSQGGNFNSVTTRSVADTNFLSQAPIGFRNCFGYASSGNIFGLYDRQIMVLDNCQGAYARNDIFNYHAHQQTGTKGSYITVYETDCSGHDAGYTGFNDGAPTSTSDNGSTGHDSIHILVANGSYNHTLGAVMAYVNGATVVALNTTPSDPYGAANPKALYWHCGAGAGVSPGGLYLWGCKGNDGGDATVILMTNSGVPNGGEANGQIYVKYWRGQTAYAAGQVVGTLKDWNGNVLPNLAAAV